MHNSRVSFLLLIAMFLLNIDQSQAQLDTLSAQEQLGGDGYREGQYPGLGRAASNIFYSDKAVSFSGYAELANVFNGGEPRDLSSGDLELYYNQLYRIVPFIGVRINKSIFLTAEFGFEHLEGNGESETHFFPELYMDFIVKKWMSFRAGLQPLNIGYINNNEEPLLYQSVNRPETERLILPTEWIELGVTIYGDLFNKFNYALGFTNGVLAKDFKSSTWIRGGAEGQVESFNKLAINAQINYLPVNNVTLSASTYYNESGRDETVIIDGESRKVAAPVTVFSGYARWDYKGFSLIGMGTYGTLGQTEEVYQLTEDTQGEGQVIGEEAYGFYLEPSYDLLQVFGKSKSTSSNSNKFFTVSNPELPIFIRYERMDTHSEVAPELEDLDYVRNNLNIWMVGFNYKPNHHIALKFDVRFRDNLDPQVDVPESETLYELGIGIEF
jgi:hypothetical protein